MRDKQKTSCRKHCVTDPVGTEAGIQVDLWRGIPRPPETADMYAKQGRGTISPKLREE